MNAFSRIEPARQGSGPLFQAPACVVALIAVLVVIHLGLWLAGEQMQIWSVLVFSFIPARISGAAAFPAIYGSQVWAFLTYAFLHANLAHLVLNCLWLLIFGTITARRLGALRFYGLAAITAIAGAVAMLLAYWGQGVIVVGASGAVSGMMGAAIPILFGKRLVVQDPAGGLHVYLEPLRLGDIVRQRRALLFTLVSLVITLLPAIGGVDSNQFSGGGAVAWQAHLGGFLAGLLAFYWLDRSKGLPPAHS
jgi:membrane associated rhomboid family serine protease